MVELTVGYVAGMIALATFIAQAWMVSAITYVLASILSDKETAATWTVAARALHSSWWPVILRSDSALTKGVRKQVLVLTTALPAVTILVAITGVITPLGLYEEADVASHQMTSFVYVTDDSGFGVGKTPLGRFNLSRYCEDLRGFAYVPCPYSDDVLIYEYDGERYSYNYPYGGIHSRIPDIVRQIYSSGTSRRPTTVSNYFDIQWRQLTTRTDRLIDDNTAYAVDTFRMMDSLLLDGSYKAVEGLVVDSKRGGGVGFRNHTVPSSAGVLGADWTEDLLFIEPKTECVDTNLTLDFTIVTDTLNYSQGVKDVWLVDRGGFVNLTHTYPTYDHPNAQTNPDLWRRAYKAAVLNNFFTMNYLNVTNPANETLGEHAFRYVDSTLGKSFPLISPYEAWRSLGLTDKFGWYLFGNDQSTLLPEGTVKYPNPFGISEQNFTLVNLVCGGAGIADLSNISNIYVFCGLMRGVPHRLDPETGAPLPKVDVLFTSGTRWSSPLYACASAVRAVIKTVSFRWNSTVGDRAGLGGLTILDIQEKTYDDNDEENATPTWGMEDSGLTIAGITPVWGLVDPAYASALPNISYVRKADFYLPGIGSSDPSLRINVLHGDAEGFSMSGTRNMPGSDFPIFTMNTVYTRLNELPYDLTGRGSVAVFRRWQELSRGAESAGQIVDLAWTDLAASAVVGTKGVLGPGNGLMTGDNSWTPTELDLGLDVGASGGASASSSALRGAAVTGPAPITVSVRPIVRQVRYRYAFGVPAFLLLLVVLVSFVAVAAVSLPTAAGFVFSLFGRKRSRREQGYEPATASASQTPPGSATVPEFDVQSGLLFASPLASLERRLRETSVGRVWRTLADPAKSDLRQSTAAWASLNANEEVDVSTVGNGGENGWRRVAGEASPAESATVWVATEVNAKN